MFHTNHPITLKQACVPGSIGDAVVGGKILERFHSGVRQGQAKPLPQGQVRQVNLQHCGLRCERQRAALPRGKVHRSPVVESEGNKPANLRCFRGAAVGSKLADAA